MARIFIDGFESGDHDMWDAENNAIVVSSAGLDMDGSYCLDLNSSTEYIQKSITADDEMYTAVLWRPISETTSGGIIHFYKDGTLLVSIIRNTTSKKLEAYRGSALVDTGTDTIIHGTTYLIEVRVLIHDSTGRIQVKVDGVSDIDFTGDTKEGSDTQFNRIRLGYGLVNKWDYAYFDNLILDDAAWIGDTKIQAVVPIGVGNTTGWTPSAGANWECVDEKPPNDADYVSINANDVMDTYVAGNLSGSIDNIKCVQVQSRTRIEGAPTPTNLKLVVRSGGTDYLSGNKSVSAAEKGLWNLWEDNPADSLAWEEADVNAMEIGIKSAA